MVDETPVFVYRGKMFSGEDLPELLNAAADWIDKENKMYRDIVITERENGIWFVTIYLNE